MGWMGEEHSTDATHFRCLSFSNTHPRAKVTLHTPNAGAAKTAPRPPKTDEKRPVKWVKESGNVWRVVYAD